MKTISPLSLLDPVEGIRLCADNAQLYLRMLNRFLSETTMDELMRSIENAELSSAFLHAHTLKGLCAQLALPALGASCSVLCDLLRTQDAAQFNTAQEQFESLLQTYQQTLDAISHYLVSNSSPAFVF